MLAAGFLAGGSRQEKASVRLPCFGKKLAANGRWFMPVQPLEKTNEPHGLAQLGGVSGENENF
jgi:hypothetical protein